MEISIRKLDDDFIGDAHVQLNYSNSIGGYHAYCGYWATQELVLKLKDNTQIVFPIQYQTGESHEGNDFNRPSMDMEICVYSSDFIKVIDDYDMKSYENSDFSEYLPDDIITEENIQKILETIREYNPSISDFIDWDKIETAAIEDREEFDKQDDQTEYFHHKLNEKFGYNYFPEIY